MNIFSDMLKYDGQAVGLFDPMRTHFSFANDFQTINRAVTSTTGEWTATADGTPLIAPSATAGFQRGGWAEYSTRASGTTIEDEFYVGTGASISLDTGKWVYLGARVALVEAATNVASFAFGLINAVAANTIQDGGVPIVDADKAILYKSDLSLNWNAQTSKSTGAGTNVRTSLAVATFASATAYELGIVWQPNRRAADAESTMHYFVNGIEVATHQLTTGTATSTITAKPTAMMMPFFGVKAGSGAVQSFLVDWFAWAVQR